MDLLAGKQIFKFDGSPISFEDAVEKKRLVGLYFSAHWCPPCKRFTPLLKNFYEEASKDDEMEIIFVSWDKSAEDMRNYLNESHGHWLYLEHESPLTQELNEKFDVGGIPTLVVLRKSDGKTISKDATDDVEEKGKDAIKEWK